MYYELEKLGKNSQKPDTQALLQQIKAVLTAQISIKQQATKREEKMNCDRNIASIARLVTQFADEKKYNQDHRMYAYYALKKRCDVILKSYAQHIQDLDLRGIASTKSTNITRSSAAVNNTKQQNFISDIRRSTFNAVKLLSDAFHKMSKVAKHSHILHHLLNLARYITSQTKITLTHNLKATHTSLATNNTKLNKRNKKAK